jgi:hypothetical protein
MIEVQKKEDGRMGGYRLAAKVGSIASWMFFVLVSGRCECPISSVRSAVAQETENYKTNSANFK